LKTKQPAKFGAEQQAHRASHGQALVRARKLGVL